MSYKPLFRLSTVISLPDSLRNAQQTAPIVDELDFMDMEFMRSWAVYDSTLAVGPREFRWGALLGLSLATAVSASIWAGIGLILTNLVN